MTREILSLKVIVDGEDMYWAARQCPGLPDELRVTSIAVARQGIRSLTGIIDDDMKAAGMFSLAVQREFLRRVNSGPTAQRTIIQEVPSDE